MLADAPTGNPDPKNAHNAFGIFRRLAEERGLTVITMTHDPLLAEHTHRQVHIVDGHMVAAAGPETPLPFSSCCSTIKPFFQVKPRNPAL